MIDILACAFLVFGLLGMLKERHIDATVYGDDLAYDRPSYGIPGSQEDGQTRQAHRPTVSLGVTSAVASSCGYYRGHIEQHAAQ
jgi:hypothetical protein